MRPTSVPRVRSARKICSIRPVGVLCTMLLALALLATPAAFAAEHVVVTDGLTFSPSELTIQVGDTVTWTNAGGGSHNVVSDDGLFTSGPPSSDNWSYSYTFHAGGSFGYHCEQHQNDGMVGTVTVAGLFGDAFESATFEPWSGVEPERADCTCYFSSDCASGTFCDYGPGGFQTEDICTWVDVKPDGVPGAGCNTPHVGPWGGEICDGVCAASAQGSVLGIESAKVLTEGVRHWAEAILGPSLAGGGVLDPVAVQRAESLPYLRDDSAELLGRYVADLLVLSGTQGFYKHFCHHEQYPDEPEPTLWVDLSESPCAAAMAALTIDATLAELTTEGAAATLIGTPPLACGAWPQAIDESCPAGGRSCLVDRVVDFVEFLTTPNAASVAGLSLP